MQAEAANPAPVPSASPGNISAHDRRPVDNVERRLWRDCSSARALLSVAVGLSLLGSACWFALVWFLSDVIGRVFLSGESVGDVSNSIIIMFALLVSRSGFIIASEMLAQRAAGQVKGEMRARVSAKLIALGPLYTRGERVGDLVHTAVQGVETLDEYITQYQVSRYLAGLVPALVFVLVLVLDPWTLPILLFTGPLLLVFLALIGSRTRELTRRREDELAWMSAHFLDVLQGLPTLKMFGRSKEQAETIETISRSHGSLTMDVLRTAFQTSLVLELGATAATALVAITVSVRLMDGLVPFNVALTVLLLTPEFFLPMRRLSMSYHAGSAGRAAAERIYAVLDQQLSALVARRTGARVPERMRLRFDNVRFAYDHGDRPALNGFTLDIPEGRILALKGPSGAGKSTVANLLLRFAEPDSGTIVVDGVRLDEIDSDKWRTQVAWVPQHPYFFHGTVAENLRIARPNASTNELMAAAHDAHADTFITALPQAYDTQIGERGARLSGGQLQRLAIARALLKNAPLIIFDEPTSHLDAESERQISVAMRTLMEGRTAIIIAHRLGPTRDADLVVEMDHGRFARITRPDQSLTLRVGAVTAAAGTGIAP